jgi:hypothetical protein
MDMGSALSYQPSAFSLADLDFDVPQFDKEKFYKEIVREPLMLPSLPLELIADS